MDNPDFKKLPLHKYIILMFDKL